jgi:hypothetical protein
MFDKSDVRNLTNLIETKIIRVKTTIPQEKRVRSGLNHNEQLSFEI